ncbi:hypothetical protein QAD02_014938 [Eretmocerus hayati]|uniref:Uncharacterized protein n=1 Tax=Eretmocerus hayati TaxID=131215 RepID=A0ACC2P8G6_9HYME|nr:hypothetical protein QAD02_014938 [Eretmocerus hayati]
MDEMDQAAQDYSVGYSQFLEILAQANSTKPPNKKGCVTLQQREMMLDFICENPELITHSSTKDSEIELWAALKDRLNAVGPAKSVESWKKFWRDWKSIFAKNPESTWTAIDQRLNKFLRQIGGDMSPPIHRNKSTLTLRQLDDRINLIEDEKQNLNFEIDQMDYEIIAHKNSINDLKKKIEEKKKTCRSLQAKKVNLHKKRMNILQTNANGSLGSVNQIQTATD